MKSISLGSARLCFFSLADWVCKDSISLFGPNFLLLMRAIGQLCDPVSILLALSKAVGKESKKRIASDVSYVCSSITQLKIDFSSSSIWRNFYLRLGLYHQSEVTYIQASRLRELGSRVAYCQRSSWSIYPHSTQVPANAAPKQSPWPPGLVGWHSFPNVPQAWIRVTEKFWC